MSIHILDQLDVPGYPIRTEEVDILRQGAQSGARAAGEISGDLADPDLLDLVILRAGTGMLNPLTPGGFIGMGLGARAAKKGLDIESIDGDGYSFSEAIELHQLTTGKEIGSEAAMRSGGQLDKVPCLLGGSVTVAREGYTSLRSMPALIGYSIGVREFMLIGEQK